MLNLEAITDGIAGAIVLLAEAGDWSTALEWGQAWLSINSSSACAKDVACCVASAYCDQAAAKMETSADVALECQAALKLGLALLRRHDCGQALQAEIQQTLQVELTQTPSKLHMRSLPYSTQGCGCVQI